MTGTIVEPDSFAGHRTSLDIAKVDEGGGNLQGTLDLYVAETPGRVAVGEALVGGVGVSEFSIQRVSVSGQKGLFKKSVVVGW